MTTARPLRASGSGWTGVGWSGWRVVAVVVMADLWSSAESTQATDAGSRPPHGLRAPASIARRPHDLVVTPSLVGHVAESLDEFRAFAGCDFQQFEVSVFRQVHGRS